MDRYPAGPVPGTLHALQRQAGNSGLQRIINAPVTASALLRCGTHPCDCPAEVQLRAELPVSRPQDPAEREADRVADEVMRTPAGYRTPIQAAPVAAVPARSARPRDSATNLAALIGEACRRGGQPLPPDSRNFMEGRFASDFSSVRVHADTAAGELARQVRARAFTTGNHVFFAAGEFQPNGGAGQHLLAHELTHVLQQRGAADRRDPAANRQAGRRVTGLLADEDEQDHADPEEPVRVMDWWREQSGQFDPERVYFMAEPASPGVLIGHLGARRHDVVPDAILTALSDWTGQDFGRRLPLAGTIRQWQSWWSVNREHYDAGRRYFHGYPVP